MKTATEDTTETLAAIAARLGLSLESSAPSPGVDPAQSKDDKPWPHIAYDVTLSRHGRKVWSGPHKLGVGHVKPDKIKLNAWSPGWYADERALLETWQRKPHADFIDKELQARVAAKLATAQKVSPKLEDVLHSLLSDGSAYFDAQSFEDWCADFGYDPDSRKAESLWKACDDIGRQLARAFSPAELAQLREAASNH